MAHDVFLSYRSEDKATADRLCSGLESHGINCWIAPRNIAAGTEWPAAIVAAIGACKMFVLILSAHSKNERQISREAELADKHGSQIITFRIEDVEPPPGLNYFLGNIQWLDAFDGRFDEALLKLVQVIKKAPEAGTNPLPPPAPRPIYSPSPLPDAAGSVARTDAARKPVPWIGWAAGIAAAVIAAGTWFGMHRSQPVPAPDPAPRPAADEMSQAKSLADRFLNERETGNLNSAWAEYSDTFRNDIDRSKWLAAQAELQQHGHVTNRFNGCTVAGNGYFCDYTLAFADGTAQRSKLWLVRNRNGDWCISRSELRPSPKS